MMANGSILVVGGEEGSNGKPRPTLEVLPKPAGGATLLTMDWLLRTDPNNLYPFLYVLPTGGIFVIYYNEARILDEVTFDTIKTFPIAPGAVSVPGGGMRVGFFANRNLTLFRSHVSFGRLIGHAPSVLAIHCTSRHSHLRVSPMSIYMIESNSLQRKCLWSCARQLRLYRTRRRR